MNCEQTCRPEKVGAVSPFPVCLEREKVVAEAHAQETLSKQSLQGQVSAKLTKNNASSNSRLTVVGRQATAADTILRTVYRLFFFFFSLPLMREQLNYNCKLKNLLKLYCI
jgi:hypothetical protein